MTTKRPVVDFGNAPSIFADRLVLEVHGPVTHLVFCHDQHRNVGQREWPDQESVLSVVDCRVRPSSSRCWRASWHVRKRKSSARAIPRRSGISMW
jgi:hypothetical protein